MNKKLLTKKEVIEKYLLRFLNLPMEDYERSIIHQTNKHGTDDYINFVVSEKQKFMLANFFHFSLDIIKTRTLFLGEEEHISNEDFLKMFWAMYDILEPKIKEEIYMACSINQQIAEEGCKEK